MLVQLDKNQTGMVEVPISILIGESFADDFFCFHVVKTLMPILPILSSL